MDTAPNPFNMFMGALLWSMFSFPFVIGLARDCGMRYATDTIQTEIAACNKQKMSYNRLEIRENSRGFVRCIDHRTNQTKLVPVTY